MKCAEKKNIQKAQLHNSQKSNTLVSSSQEKSILGKQTHQLPNALQPLQHGYFIIGAGMLKPQHIHPSLINLMMSFPNKVSMLAEGGSLGIIALCSEGSFISYSITTLELIWQRWVWSSTKGKCYYILCGNSRPFWCFWVHKSSLWSLYSGDKLTVKKAIF